MNKYKIILTSGETITLLTFRPVFELSTNELVFSGKNVRRVFHISIIGKVIQL